MYFHTQHGSIYSTWLWYFYLLIVKPLNCSSQFLTIKWQSATRKHLFLFLQEERSSIRKLKNASGLTSFSATTTSIYLPKPVLTFFLIGIHSMKGWTATLRYGVTRKRITKRLKHTRNLFRKNPTVKRRLLILSYWFNKCNRNSVLTNKVKKHNWIINLTCIFAPLYLITPKK